MSAEAVRKYGQISIDEWHYATTKKLLGMLDDCSVFLSSYSNYLERYLTSTTSVPKQTLHEGYEVGLYTQDVYCKQLLG